MDRIREDEDVEPNAAKAIKSGEARYLDLMEFVPIAVVRLDRSRLARTFARLRSRGVEDLGPCFGEHPRFLRAAMNSICYPGDVDDGEWLAEAAFSNK